MDTYNYAELNSTPELQRCTYRFEVDSEDSLSRFDEEMRHLGIEIGTYPSGKRIFQGHAVLIGTSTHPEKAELIHAFLARSIQFRIKNNL